MGDVVILDSVKRAVGIPPEVTSFDDELLLHLNSVLAELTQLGVGPKGGVFVEQIDTVWSEFFDEDPRLSMVKIYVGLQTRILFDPPTPGYVLDAYKERVKELSWRIMVVADEKTDEKS